MPVVTRLQKKNFAEPRCQNFVIPTFMKNYIFKNWTPLAYEKMMQTCKLIFSTHRMIVVDVGEEYPTWCGDIETPGQICYNEKNIVRFNRTKLWLTGRANIAPCEEDFLYIYPGAIRSDVHELSIYEAILDVKGFAVIAPKLRIIDLCVNGVIYDMDKKEYVGFHELLEMVPQIEKFNGQVLTFYLAF